MCTAQRDRSTPVFAGMLALLQDLTTADGDTSLPAWINPTLYELHRTTPGVFTDVVRGNNNCQRYDANEPFLPCGACTCFDGTRSGFPATEGWDPVTGLGTVNFRALREALNVSRREWVSSSSSSHSVNVSVIIGIVISFVVLGGSLIAIYAYLLMRRSQRREGFALDRNIGLLQNANDGNIVNDADLSDDDSAVL